MSQSALAQKIYTPATVVNIFHHQIGSNELFLSNCLKRWVYPAIPEISSTLVYITNIINSHKTVLPLSNNKNNFSCAGHQRSLKKLVQVKRSFVRPSAPLPPAPLLHQDAAVKAPASCSFPSYTKFCVLMELHPPPSQSQLLEYTPPTLPSLLLQYREVVNGLLNNNRKLVQSPTF